MNIGEIAERLILAAEIEEAAARYRVGPKHAQSLSLPYAHDWTDRNGWGEKRNQEESDRLWQSVLHRPTPAMVSEAEEAWGWLALVENDKWRAALAAWARCMANKHEHFKKWCLRRGIHPITGRRWKNAAIDRICAHLNGSDVQNIDSPGFGMLPEDRKISDIADNIAARTVERKGVLSWAEDGAFTSILTNDPKEFSWAEKRNELRRQREARKRKEQKAA